MANTPYANLKKLMLWRFPTFHVATTNLVINQIAKHKTPAIIANIMNHAKGEFIFILKSIYPDPLLPNNSLAQFFIPIVV
jgi:hypothetical protein